MSYELDPVRGVLNHYGTMAIDEKRGGVILDDDLYKYVEYTFHYDDLPTYATDGLTVEIPAGATIKSVAVDVITAFAGAGTETYNFGLYQKDGTVIDATGFLSAQAITGLTAGAHIDAAGALIGTNISAAGQLTVAASAGTVTAGSARVLIKYIPKPATTV